MLGTLHLDISLKIISENLVPFLTETKVITMNHCDTIYCLLRWENSTMFFVDEQRP